MPLTWNEVALLVAAGALAVLAAYLIALVRRLQRMLALAEEAVLGVRASIENSFQQLAPAIDRLTVIEDEFQATLKDCREGLTTMQAEVGLLSGDLRAAVGGYHSMAKTIEKRIDQDLPPILEDVQGVAAQMQGLTATLNERIKDTNDFFETARETGRTVRLGTRLVREGATGLAVQAVSTLIGVKKSLEIISLHFMGKGGGKR